MLLSYTHYFNHKLVQKDEENNIFCVSLIILGISAYYHDSAACIIKDDKIIAAAQEERFTRKKHDNSFPVNAVQYVLSELDEDVSRIQYVAFYDKPLLKFERLLETFHAFVPRSFRSFLEAIPVWLREKLHIRQNVKKELKRIGFQDVEILFPEHHLSHAASAFYPSPFSEAAILTLDGVGEWSTATIGHGEGNNIKIIREMHFPHSLGLLYSSFTYYCGFKVNSGEYKLMGLAPYGQSEAGETKNFIKKITGELVDIRPDGSFLLNMKYFGFATGLKMTNDRRWEKLFGIPPRKPEAEISQSYCNLALAIQRVTEQIILQLAKTAEKLTNSDHLVLAGGVALNSVANRKLKSSGLFKNIWIQPAAGDAGGALGAALAVQHVFKKNIASGKKSTDAMAGAFLGPAYSDKEIYRTLSKYEASYSYFDDFDELCRKTASLLDEGNVVGWFQERMEFGPRALGNRSILADPRNKQMQKKLNLQIKFRESFRPFAPAVLQEFAHNYFETDGNSPYMLFVAPLKLEKRKKLPENYDSFSLQEKLYTQHSDIPAVTHVDFSSRIQTVERKTNEKFHRLLEYFYKLTGCPALVNTSFNVRGEPIVCTPEDAFKCFMKTGMDYLVMGNYFLRKEKQVTKNFSGPDSGNKTD